MPDWRPTADTTALQARAQMLADIRDYFREQPVLEVETPILNPATVTDPQIESLSVHDPNVSRRGFLHTSPEYAMKRLLANGSGSIYQIARVFRAEEYGRWHSREFSMLEWYRVNWDDTQLMQDVQNLISRLCNRHNIIPLFTHMTYRDLFQTCVGIDAITASVDELRSAVRQQGIQVDLNDDWDREALLDLLMSHSVSDWLREKDMVFVYEYPAAQAALARLDHDNPSVARRFELFAKGIELANGFQELVDADVQRERFENDRHKRKQHGQVDVTVDEHLIQALRGGLPDCSGVALGLDRLLAYLLGRDNIQSVMAFYQE